MVEPWAKIPHPTSGWGLICAPLNKGGFFVPFPFFVTSRKCCRRDVNHDGALRGSCRGAACYALRRKAQRSAVVALITIPRPLGEGA